MKSWSYFFAFVSGVFWSAGSIENKDEFLGRVIFQLAGMIITGMLLDV